MSLTKKQRRKKRPRGLLKVKKMIMSVTLSCLFKHAMAGVGIPAIPLNCTFIDTSVPKEPSRSRQRAIQAVAKMLLESPKLEQAPDINWVRKSCNEPDDFTQVECAAVVRIVGTFRDYTPKRREKQDGGTAPPEHNAATMIRAVLLSNHLLRYTGYTDFTWQFSPAPSISSLHLIPLGAAGLYEALCPSSAHHFEAKIDETHSITSVEYANKNQLAIFASFFDIKKIEQVCAIYGFKFANR